MGSVNNIFNVYDSHTLCPQYYCSLQITLKKMKMNVAIICDVSSRNMYNMFILHTILDGHLYLVFVDVIGRDKQDAMQISL